MVNVTTPQMRDFVLRNLDLLNQQDAAILILRYAAICKDVPTWAQISPLVGACPKVCEYLHDNALINIVKRTNDPAVPHTLWDIKADFHAVKLKARTKATAAIASGRLVRQPCNICGAAAEHSEAHHRNYYAPLAITWLCADCHNLEHTFAPNRAMLLDTEMVRTHYEERSREFVAESRHQ